MQRLNTRLLQTVPHLQNYSESSYVTLSLFNVKSIVAKLPDLKQDSDLKSASILCFCETWLAPSQPSPSVQDNHVVLRCDRAMNDTKGGTMISVPQNMQPNHTYTFASSGVEVLATTVLLPNASHLQVVLIYRSPSVGLPLFVDILTRMLNHVSITNIPTLVRFWRMPASQQS